MKLPHLQPDSITPIYRQLYDYMRAAILSGQIAPGTKLPSSRAFAAELGTSRNTVLHAYDQLIAEGYLESAPGKGLFVSETLPEALLHPRTKPPLSSAGTDKLPPDFPAHVQALLKSSFMPPASTRRRPFRSGAPALDEFPYAVWTKLLARHTHGLHPDVMIYQEPSGYAPLREAIAEHVILARQVRCTPEQVVIVSGAQAGLYLASRLILTPGQSAWIEDPGYLGARNTLTAAGARIVPIPVDEHGLRVEVGIERAPDAKLVYVTPSHQFPLGMTLSLARRLKLLEWARQQRAYILEDDYDSEYRFIGNPLASLQGLDQDDVVIYIGTFSKVLFPSLRLGYLIVPPALVEAATRMRIAMQYHPPLFEQMVVTDFITEGHFARHIRRMRALYAARRAALIDSLNAAKLPLDVQPSETGMQLIGWLRNGMDDRLAVQRAAENEVNVLPVSMFTLEHPIPPGLILGYAAFDQDAIQRGVERLAAALSEKA